MKNFEINFNGNSDQKDECYKRFKSFINRFDFCVSFKQSVNGFVFSYEASHAETLNLLARAKSIAAKCEAIAF